LLKFEDRDDGSLLGLAVIAPGADRKRGNPWVINRWKRRYAHSPPGVKVRRGLRTLMGTSGRTKGLIDEHVRACSPDSMAVAPAEGDRVRVRLYVLGQTVDDFTVPRNVI